mmetsp:Transcript_19401/g.33368  ORF Transcript_19401/g.33368 Transcript_19401/m.33368 type:complete len:271 (+) Transcript_19401:138-950(+)
MRQDAALTWRVTQRLGRDALVFEIVRRLELNVGVRETLEAVIVVQIFAQRIADGGGRRAVLACVGHTAFEDVCDRRGVACAARLEQIGRDESVQQRLTQHARHGARIESVASLRVFVAAKLVHGEVHAREPRSQAIADGALARLLASTRRHFDRKRVAVRQTAKIDHFRLGVLRERKRARTDVAVQPALAVRVHRRPRVVEQVEQRRDRDGAVHEHAPRHRPLHERAKRLEPLGHRPHTIRRRCVQTPAKQTHDARMTVKLDHFVYFFAK